MHIDKRLENLITTPRDVNGSAIDQVKSSEFSNLLNDAMDILEVGQPAPKALALRMEPEANEIPSWVDLNYGYDPQSPRKPNMRELMQAIAGQSLEDLYNGSRAKVAEVSRLASELLYGVTGAVVDTRNWQEIMTAPDVVEAARDATGKMFEPEVDIISHRAPSGQIDGQSVVIKDSSGNTLRVLPRNIDAARETLQNFGVTADDVARDIAEKADPDFINSTLINFINNFGKSYAPVVTEQLEALSSKDYT